MENILDIIYDASFNKRILEEKDIQEIIDLYINEIDSNIIKKYYIIKDRKFVFNKICLGNYIDDYIEIYYGHIVQYLEHFCHLTDFETEKELSFFEQVMRSNLYFLRIILHEFEHSIQEEVYINNDNSSFKNKLIILESFFDDHFGGNTLIKYGIDLNSKTFELGYLKYLEYRLSGYIDRIKQEKNYHLSYLERLADINSIKKIILLLESIKKDVPNLYKLENQILLERKLRDYNTCKKSPTIDFFVNILGKKNFDYSDMPEYKTDEALDLGLPIKGQDYARRIIKLKNGKY